MEPTYKTPDGNGTLYTGDCLEVLKELPENSVDAIITDPPWGIFFMSSKQNWDNEVPRKIYWQEILRVAKPGAFLLAFGATKKWHHLTFAIENASWEIKDTLMWLWGSGFPTGANLSKNIDKAAGATRKIIGSKLGLPGYSLKENDTEAHNREACGKFTNAESECSITAPATDAVKLWDGYFSSLKPAWSPIILAMKPLDGNFAQNVKKWNCGGLNIDACRIPLNGDYKSKPNGRPSMTGLGDNYDPAKANQPDTIGRFPANLLLSEEAAEMLDAQTGTLTSGTGAVKRASGKGYNPNAYGKESRPVGTPNVEYGDSGGASRFFYCAKASKKERGEGNNHTTVKPLNLCKWLCRLVSMPQGSVILDPFAGSGSIGVAALQEGQKFIGIEISPEYSQIAIKRLSTALDAQ